MGIMTKNLETTMNNDRHSITEDPSGKTSLFKPKQEKFLSKPPRSTIIYVE